METECPICLESVKKTVLCNGCEYKTCVSCMQTFILSRPRDAHCMNCGLVFSRDFLSDHLQKVFMQKSYKDHLQEVRFAEVQLRLPETIPYIHLLEQYEQVSKELHQITFQMHQLKLQKEQTELLLTRIRRNKERMREGRPVIPVGHEETKQPSEEDERARQRYTRPCVSDHCRGFVDRQGICGLCQSQLCLHCNIAKNTDLEHVCKPEDLESWDHILQSTRPCPKCHVRIHRISGCNQMWCPQCQTAFNYRTGEIEKGPVHNPHYFEWLRRNNPTNLQGVPQDVCNRQRGVAPHTYMLQNIMRLHRSYFPNDIQDKILLWIRYITHVRAVDIRSIETIISLDPTLDLRVQYLQKRIEPALFKKKIQERYKKRDKYREYRDILTTFVEVATDQFWNLHDEPKFFDYNTLTELLEFSNLAILRLNKSYQSKISLLNPIKVK